MIKLQEEAVVFIFDEYLGIDKKDALRHIKEAETTGESLLKTKFRVEDFWFKIDAHRMYVTSKRLEEHPRTQMRISGANERLAQIFCCFKEVLVD